MTTMCPECSAQDLTIRFGSTNSVCLPNPCQNNGLCMVLANDTFICTCTSEYIGKFFTYTLFNFNFDDVLMRR